MLLLASSYGAAAGRRLVQQQVQQKAYKNIWDAATSEIWFMEPLLKNISYWEWESSSKMQSQKAIAQRDTLPSTVFMPGPQTAFERQAEAQCLTLDQWMRVLIDAGPNLTAAYVQSMILPGKIVNSSTFPSLAMPEVKLRTGFATDAVDLRLGTRERNGITQWVLQNASGIRQPGSNYSWEDIGIDPKKMDIKAGASLVHVLDLPIRVNSLNDFWAEKRRKALRDAGYPEDSSDCPNLKHGPANKPRKSSSPPIGLVVGCSVGGALLLALAVLGALFLRRRGYCGGGGAAQAAGDVKRSGDAPQDDKTVEGDSNRGGGPGGSAADANSLKDQDCTPTILAQQGQPVHTSQLPPSMRMGVYVNAGSNSTCTSSGVHEASSSSMSAGYGAFGIMPQNSDNSPFAMVIAESQGFSTQLTPPPPSNATTVRSSQRGYSSRSNNSSGSNQASEESRRDRVAPLPTLYTNDDYNLDGGAGNPDYNSYQGGLLLTESMPMGQIPQALVVQFSELKLDDLIGAGAEGKVYRGTWKHTDIAAKEYLPHLPVDRDSNNPNRPLSDAARANAQAALAKEVYWLTRLNHPNLVRFCAVCLERPMLVMEYYRNGSVFDIIRKAELEMGDMTGPAQPSPAQQCIEYLSWDRRLMMLHDVAAGMSYLHGRNHIHGDLRSPNLFVGADGKVKIGDFGFTKRLASNNASLRVARITHPRWVAPELLMDNILSRNSDVYSFGVIMFELLTFRIPFEGLRKEQVVLEVMRGQRPEVPPEDELPPGTSTHSCLETYIRLMEECWAQEASERPCFEVIARRLKAMQRWRKLKLRMHRVGETARRVHSMPAMAQPGRGSQQGALTDSAADSRDDEGEAAGPVARRVVSEPAAGSRAAEQQLTPIAARLRQELLQPMPAPAWQPPLLPQLPPTHSLEYARGVSSIPEAEGDEHRLSGSQDSIGPPHTTPFLSDQTGAHDDNMSSLVSSAVVHGARLAIIPTGPAVEEDDALSVMDPEQLAAARRVLLVASDLPSRYQSSVLEHGIQVRRSWRRHLRRNNT